MNISQITVHYSYTFNMGDYSNIKPGISLTIELDAYDEPAAALAELQAQAEAHVHGVIDQRLETEERPPYFYDGPRYRLIQNKEDKIVVIAPDGDILAPNPWDQMYIYLSGRRYEIVKKKVIEKIEKGWTLYDCSDGDFSKLPELEKFFYYLVDDDRHTDDRYLLVGPDSLKKKDLPESWQDYWVCSQSSIRLRENFIRETKQQAKENNLILLTCWTDEDLANVPELVLKREESDQDPMPDKWEYGDGDDDDEYYND